MENKVIINLDEYMQMRKCIEEMDAMTKPLTTFAKKSRERVGYDPLCSEYKTIITIGEGHVVDFLKKVFDAYDVVIERKGKKNDNSN